MQRRPTTNEFNVIRGILNEELGINREAYAKRGKGPKALRAAKESLKSGGWGADSNTVEDLPREHMSRKGGVDPVSFVKNKVIDLMSDAQRKGVEMTHGEAHQLATHMLKQHMGQA